MYPRLPADRHTDRHEEENNRAVFPADAFSHAREGLPSFGVDRRNHGGMVPGQASTYFRGRSRADQLALRFRMSLLWIKQHKEKREALGPGCNRIRQAVEVSGTGGDGRTCSRGLDKDRRRGRSPFRPRRKIRPAKREAPLGRHEGTRGLAEPDERNQPEAPVFQDVHAAARILRQSKHPGLVQPVQFRLQPQGRSGDYGRGLSRTRPETEESHAL